MTAKRENEHAWHEADVRSHCTERSCATFNVKKYLHQLRQVLPYVPPLPVRELRSLHERRDYEGIVRLVRKTMNIEVDLLVGWVNSGGMKDAPAWVKVPSPMPFYGSKAFREMRIEINFRKSFLEQSTYDQVAVAVAHELSHIVLDSLGHPLRKCEKAVDLTAMLLGFRRLYRSACYTERRSGNSTRIETLGYLSQQEALFVDQILAQDHWRSKFKALPLRRALMIGAILFLVFGAAALVGPWFYSIWQLHQSLLAQQVEIQKQIPWKASTDVSLTAVRVGLTTLTSIYNVTNPVDLRAWEMKFSQSLCASNSRTREMIDAGASYDYKFSDGSNGFVGQFKITSCP